MVSEGTAERLKGHDRERLAFEEDEEKWTHTQVCILVPTFDSLFLSLSMSLPRRAHPSGVTSSEPGRATLEPDLAAGETGSRTVS